MGLRDALIFVLTAPWLALGPANVYKISMINRGSPMAKYIVVPPAEECQAACNIARMWGCLFWGLQAVVAGGIVAGGVGDRTAAAAKLYVGAALAVAYKEDVVREVVAAGAALDCDPNRVTLKRAVLTGLPARTHKRKAVVKQMFYNPRDVLYFKPAALTTKHGLTCHITEPIGTHGHFKVALSKPMKQNDTILLTLYKRVYPKLPGGDDDDAPLAIS
mmetsp:Transcript_13423/g.43324  ORF Transcript_13423/g.43324 Transcript_13423/m.43324 type:complete len:218 (+) Transcript_13423:218-871(+)